jgi:hypothetical protein
MIAPYRLTMVVGRRVLAATATAYSGSDDPDGDGKTNAVEFAQKTDPLP